MPAGLAGEAIPPAARILGLAQTAEVYARAFGVEAAVSVALERRGSWFDPALVDALRALKGDRAFWAEVLGPSPRSRLAGLEPDDQVLAADDARLDVIAEAFARVIDAKSPYTYRHSEGVAEVAVEIGEVLGFEPTDLRDLRRAALLHDIGKLGVSNLILDKPGRLTEEEVAQVRLHPAYTQQILARVPAFESIVEPASAHHERLDGRGYHLGVPAEWLSPKSRVLAVADVYEALTADRPYRAGLPREEVVGILRREAGSGLCPASVEAILTRR
jgi:putative nucleotidyltransferase with HDIG domain